MTLDMAMKVLADAEAAYTSAVQAAAQTGMWSLVSVAHQAVDQARSALEALQVVGQ